MTSGGRCMVRLRPPWWMVDITNIILAMTLRYWSSTPSTTVSRIQKIWQQQVLNLPGCRLNYLTPGPVDISYLCTFPLPFSRSSPSTTSGKTPTNSSSSPYSPSTSPRSWLYSAHTFTRPTSARPCHPHMHSWSCPCFWRPVSVRYSWTTPGTPWSIRILRRLRMLNGGSFSYTSILCLGVLPAAL